MNDNTNNRLKNFLVNGFQGLDSGREELADETFTEEIVEESAEPVTVTEQPAAPTPADNEAMKAIESELIRIRFLLEDLEKGAAPAKAEMPDMSAYLTTREQGKAVNATVARLESASGNKALIHAMEQISIMREDFFRLCSGMRAGIDKMDAETVLSSFEAYEVDMENILTDAGVYIGKFDYDKLNTLHQRIVGIVPTDEKEKDGTIAERQTDGYKLGDKVLMKERVTVYKYSPGVADADASEVETVSQTDSETTCSKAAEDAGEESGTDSSMEEKE